MTWELAYKFASIAGPLGVLCIVSNLAWTVVHEFAHLIAAKLTCGVSEWEMKIWPCKLDGAEVGGYLKYVTIRPQTNYGRALVSLAPFIITTLACIALPILVVTKSVILLVIISAGWLDHVSGSIVSSDLIWDLPRAANKLNVPFWIMRLCSLSIALASAAASIYLTIDIIRSLN